MNKKELLRRIAAGETFKYHLFWKGPLSQWKASVFREGGVKYITAEHYMMAEKARLFNDNETLARILKAETPREAKALGRQVANYNEEKWANARFDAVVRGNVLKFTQREDLCKILLETGDDILVEASPEDEVWGIGLPDDHPDACNPASWRGVNLLGFALMEARNILRTRGGK